MPDSSWVHSGTPQAPSKSNAVLAWIKGNRDAVLGSLVMLAGAAIFATWVAGHRADLREKAWQNLFIAQQVVASGNLPEAAKQLDSIETSFGNTSAWGFAVLAQGDVLFRQEKFKEAEAEYSKITAKGPKNLLPFAIYDLGKAKEAAGDYPGAQGQYTEFLTSYPGHFMAPEVHYSLASTYELAGNADQAKAAYEKILLLYPETSWATMAKDKVTPPAQKAASPQPAKTGAPAAKPAPAAQPAK